MNELYEVVLEHDELAELDAAGRRLALRDVLADRVEPGALERAVRTLADAIDAFGPITDLMADESVTDVLINGPREVWVERAGVLEPTSVSFSGVELDRLIDRLVGDAGQRVDAGKPIADARLADGSRIHVVLPPLAPRGPLVSIRRFPQRSFDLDALVCREMLTKSQAHSLANAVADKRTILISGATGTGKTTLLNALLGVVGDGERVVVIEETRELVPGCTHWVSLVTRPDNVEGRGGVPAVELVRAALRMRPDRIVVGEVRGPEAHAALTAMSTGHAGSLLTIHAGSAEHAVERFVSLALQGGRDSEDNVRRLAQEIFDVRVHLTRAAGARRVESIVMRP